MGDVLDDMMDNYHRGQHGECAEAFCDRPASREWMQHPMSSGFYVCQDHYEVLQRGKHG